MKLNKYLLGSALAAISANCAMAYDIADGDFQYYNVGNQYLELARFTNKNYTGVINIPDSVYVDEAGRKLPVKAIGANAFVDSKDFTGINFPATLSHVSTGAFSYTRNVIDELDLSNTEILQIPARMVCGMQVKTVTLPDCVEEMEGAIKISGSRQVVKLPKNLQSIALDMFRYWRDIEKVEMGDNVSSIDSYAFAKCTNLSSIDWPRYLEYVGFRAFDESSISEIVLHKYVSHIDGAFTNITTLKSVKCYVDDPAKFWNDNGAFRGSDLSNCTLWVPYGSEELYRNAPEWQGFAEIKGFDTTEKYDVTDGNFHYNIVNGEHLELAEFSNKAFAGRVSIPETVIIDGDGNRLPVKSIGNCAFDGCNAITGLDLPQTICDIAPYAFNGCGSNIEELDLSRTQIRRLKGLYWLPLKSIVWSECLESLGGWSFSAENMTHVKIPAGVTRNDMVFLGTKSLEIVETGNMITEIPAAQYAHTSLRSITWPESLYRVGRLAFIGTSLEEIELHRYVRWISQAFQRIQTLKSVKCHVASPDRFLDVTDAFTESDLSGCTLWVPTGSEELYRNAPVWRDFPVIKGFDPNTGMEMPAVEPDRPGTGTAYDLQGREVSDRHPGQLYIINGKKVIAD